MVVNMAIEIIEPQQTTISAGQGQDLASLLAQLDAIPYLNAM